MLWLFLQIHFIQVLHLAFSRKDWPLPSGSNKGPLLELNKGPLLELAAVDKMVNSRDTGRRENSDFWLQ